jgi:hypothetical protein
MSIPASTLLQDLPQKVTLLLLGFYHGRKELRHHLRGNER